MHIPVRALDVKQLEGKTTPAAIPGGNLEAYRATFYDTQTYPAAGVANLTFFQDTQNDPTLSNMRAAGQFPDPDYFALWGLAFDVLAPVSQAADDATAWVDVDNIVRMGRSIITLEMSQKNYGPWLATEAHGTGGITGFGIGGDTAAAQLDQAYANNGLPGQSLNLDGAITFAPKTGFSWGIRWGNPLAVSEDILVRLVMQGVIYRRIL